MNVADGADVKTSEMNPGTFCSLNRDSKCVSGSSLNHMIDEIHTFSLHMRMYLFFFIHWGN